MMSLPADFPRKPSVLCVEDDLNLQKSISFILWKEGYEVTCAQTGEEAVEIARREKPDLVLLDLVLPGIDGLKVSAILRKDPATADILIIMVSAKRGVDDVVRGLKSYADDYITKPFDPRVLLARVQSVLRRRGGTEARRENDPGDRWAGDQPRLLRGVRRRPEDRPDPGPSSRSWPSWRASRTRSSPGRRSWTT